MTLWKHRQGTHKFKKYAPFKLPERPKKKKVKPAKISTKVTPYE